MKKTLAILILLIMCLPLLAGCQSSDSMMSFEPLSDKIKAEIKDKVMSEFHTDVNWEGVGWNEAYYGTVGGFAVFQTSFEPNKYQIGYRNVAGYIFRAQASDFNLYIYRDGLICTLQEAYKNNFLTKEQIGIIHERHQEIYADWLKRKAETTGSSDLNPDCYYRDTFSEVKVETLKGLLLTKYNRDINWDTECKYMGIVNGFDVFMIMNYGIHAWDIYCTLEIADCKFQWDDPFMIYLHRDGEIYKLPEVYENGWLTKDHVSQIYEEHNMAFMEWLGLRS